MDLYRLAEEKFTRDLTGEGASLYGGRWNPKGIPMTYASESVSLAALEVLVRVVTPKRYFRVKLGVADGASMETVEVADLPTTWKLPHPNAQLIDLGKRWAQEQRSLLLKVPSAVVHGEGWNYLINPLHEQFAMVFIADVIPFDYDMRLSPLR